MSGRPAPATVSEQTPSSTHTLTLLPPSASGAGPSSLPPRQKQHAPTVLHLFSCPSKREDGIRAHLNTLGWDCSDADIINVTEEGADPDTQDLSRDPLWERIHLDLDAGQYAAVILGTPCETASRARTGPPGPRPLRSTEHIYGLPKAQLSPEENQQVRLGTYFALRSAALATRCHQLQIPWLIENPDPKGNPVSLFNLPEWQALADLPEVQTLDFHQCLVGAETAKPTRLLFFRLQLDALRGRCNHSSQKWEWVDLRGKHRHTFAPHPPLVGRRRPDGTYATKAAGAWPSAMNNMIAEACAATWPGPHPPLYQTI